MKTEGFEKQLHNSVFQEFIPKKSEMKIIITNNNYFLT
jgi:hypothetical protein